MLPASTHAANEKTDHTNPRPKSGPAGRPHPIRHVFHVAMLRPADPSLQAVSSDARRFATHLSEGPVEQVQQVPHS